MGFFLLILFSILFALTHIGMSHDPFRQRLINSLGEKAFLGIYSLMSFITFGGAIWAFVGQEDAGPVLWYLPQWLYPVVQVLVLVGFILFVLSIKNTSPMGKSPAEIEVRGVLHITRHPMNMGFAAFGLAHILANGSLGDIVFFGSIFVVGFFGAYHQDRRIAREKGESLRSFLEQTGIFPFSAIIKGKTKLALREFSLGFVALAVVAYVVVLLFHEKLFGVRPF